MAGPRLKELYLRGNAVADYREVLHLQALLPLPAALPSVRPQELHQLSALTLVGNPCAEHPQYRHLVLSALPQVKELDGVEVQILDSEYRWACGIGERS